MNPRLKENLWKWLVLPFLGSMVIALFTEWSAVKRGDMGEYLESLIISCAYWSSLANGNDFAIKLIDKRWTWLDAPVQRTIMGVIAMVTVTLVISTVIQYIMLEFYFGVSFLDQLQRNGILLYIIPFSITLFISLWFHGKRFLEEWRDAATNVERLKTENIKSKFESLRNQVNPHFLFNSLNALSSLVYDDQDKAVRFIQKLSDVYRYVLDHQNEEIVSLRKELDFLESFIYLNKIRFGENLKTTISNTNQIDNSMALPPVVLQMLVENALKHNEVSKERPLHIQIEVGADSIVVSNNINPLLGRVESSGLGLKNIQMRYEILSDNEVAIKQTESQFIVTVPILKLQA